MSLRDQISKQYLDAKEQEQDKKETTKDAPQKPDQQSTRADKG